MKLARYLTDLDQAGVASVVDDQLIPLHLEPPFNTLASILNSEHPADFAHAMRHQNVNPIPLVDATLLPPIDQQEVWAAGVTYKRSRTSRMTESAAAASCYERVYESDRPELFLKATPNRVSGHGQPLRIRYDSQWDVPEPELTLAINPRKEIVGFTIGNDMTSRDIEGENPLYLPQARIYRQCAGLGPWVTLLDDMPIPSSIGIRMSVDRGGQEVFKGETAVSEMARSLPDLVCWLFREDDFPDGVFLMTGTGIVPERPFTLQPDDIVSITIDGIGTLANPIVKGIRTARVSDSSSKMVSNQAP